MMLQADACAWRFAARWTMLVCLASMPGLVSAEGPLAADAHMDTHEAAVLYETHCRSCHTEQIHWRDGKLVTDWDSLVRQVDRWQKNLSLGWSETDVRVVAHYLNLRYYRFAPPPPRIITRVNDNGALAANLPAP
jgi:hypothetical protein